MNCAYVDTSCLVAIAFDEPAAQRMAARLRRCRRLFSSNVLEAELRSALKRQGVEGQGLHMLSWLTWVYPDRPLTREIDRITVLGDLTGADLWHLANALLLASDGQGLVFLTLDRRPREVANRLGFST